MDDDRGGEWRRPVLVSSFVYVDDAGGMLAASNASSLERDFLGRYCRDEEELFRSPEK